MAGDSQSSPSPMDSPVSRHQIARHIDGVKFRDWDINYDPTKHQVTITGYFPPRTEEHRPGDAQPFFSTKDRYESGYREYQQRERVNVMYGSPDPISFRDEPQYFGRTVPLVSTRRMWEIFDLSMILPFLKDMICDMLAHEVDENLMEHGYRVFDPHRVEAAVPA